MTFDPAPLARSTYKGPIPRHPAKWSRPVLDVITDMVRARAERSSASPGLFDSGRTCRVLDPCAGVGGIHELADTIPGVETWGVDIQPEWAAAHGRTVVGDSTRLPVEWAGKFDVVAYSPVYPNRMTDHHAAADPCGTCGGNGCEEGCGRCEYVNAGPNSHRVCTCKGFGLSRRNTYHHALTEVDAPVAAGSMAVQGWGTTHRDLATAILKSAANVLVPFGTLLLNVSNHIENDIEVPVVEWYLTLLLLATHPAPGDMAQVWALDRIIPIETKRNRQGANGEARAGQEFLLALHRKF